ncbi:MAG: orotidine-5'-phosphate decarboxylase [Candidatus Magnetominusculus sp. LBB02]|nr:orotidine-5'-phosphate decarboxylase [Candidatus Magnetominusculus sp. LBB02]
MIEQKESFVDKLIKLIKQKKSHVVVGLDPVYEELPVTIRKDSDSSLKDVSEAIIYFNKNLIDAICDHVPAIKPQIAFYERYGIEGLSAFIETVRYGREKGLMVIGDAKRNDIGTTAAAYSSAYIGTVKINDYEFKPFNVDAITVNHYLGSDGVNPFIEDAKLHGNGIFILVKTSNPSSYEIQDLTVTYREKGIKLYAAIAEMVNKWGEKVIGTEGYSSIGAVVGATFPQEASLLRKIMPKAYFLVPGYGAQGGKASDIINFFNKDGFGAIIAASRSIDYAYKNKGFEDKDFADAARDAVIRMNQEINEELKENNLLKW